MQLIYDGEYFISCQGQSNADRGIYYYMYSLLTNVAFIKEHYLEWMVHKELQVVGCCKRITSALLYIGAFVDLGL